MGYGYRSMKPEELKGYSMEITFDDMGSTSRLFTGDMWHYTKYKITYEELSKWQLSGKYAADLAWTRSEFVRQFLEDPERADSMPHSGERKWCYTGAPMRDRSAIAFHTFLTKWQA